MKSKKAILFNIKAYLPQAMNYNGFWTIRAGYCFIIYNNTFCDICGMSGMSSDE